MAGEFPSPNFGPRRGAARPDLIVLHHTGMPTCAEARARLCDPASEVSAHWLIDEQGRAEPLVPEKMRAWHGGAGGWGDVTDVNSRSIGIELANPGDTPFPNAQMVSLERLLSEAMARWGIPPARVIAHSDMAPTRKRDPGPRFDWRRLARGGLSVWPGPDGDPQADFTRSAQVFGYPEAPHATLLAAFRLRFRPWAAGPEEAGDRAAMSDLARRFPVDGARSGA